MHKWLMLVVLLAASVLSLYLLTFGLPQKPEDETAGLEAGVELLKVSASKDFVFDKKEYTVKAGQKYKLVLVNKSGSHGLAIPDLGIDLKEDKMEMEITFEEPGSYEMVCSVMCGIGHADMKSVLIVQ
ncbi:cytochrome c oxidase subunit II [Paenibacillus beijingensis]|uniref:Cytochrome C oxidase subunit II n=1 Tax=Paenibacillus beijingensis TaxID=1126833 RepID=A0A0D5NER7_9BACL|nr:cytochrome c oxidase subunit II [Paenibacillus beijingensis]AJY73418.1 cytochrome C oxidase subunit II [Paenibacillus beijingensis]